MATITITLIDCPDGHISARTDADRPIIGRGVTAAQALAMELLGTAFKRGAEVVYDPEQVPAVALALELLDPEGLGLAVTRELRDRARRALGRDKIDRSPTDGVDIDNIYRTRAAETTIGSRLLHVLTRTPAQDGAGATVNERTAFATMSQLTTALGVEPAKSNASLERQIHKCMLQLGWERCRKQQNEVRIWVYQKPMDWAPREPAGQSLVSAWLDECLQLARRPT